MVQIKKQIIDFIQDQQSHEVENETILNKIPNLVEYLTNQAISQSKEELVEEIRSKITEFAIEGGKVRDEWKGAVLYSKIMTFLEVLNKQ